MSSTLSSESLQRTSHKSNMIQINKINQRKSVNQQKSKANMSTLNYIFLVYKNMVLNWGADCEMHITIVYVVS